MDPVTHAAIGLAVSKLTGNPLMLSDVATVGIVAGSVFPDIDILLQKWGDYIYLKNHRGITHSIPGIIVSSLLIASVVSLMYRNTGFFTIFLWTLLGSVSHVVFDLLNSYGAKLLWPFTDKKFSVGMLVSFDPVMILSLAGFVFIKNSAAYALLAALPAYLCLKAAARHWAKYKLKAKFGDEYDKISLLPAITRPFRWHLILHGKEHDIIGEKKLFRNRIKLVKKLEKADLEGKEEALLSETGRFFNEFTPLCHVTCESDGEIDRYIFTDMRYYLKDDFLHHAVVELDKNNKVVSQTFNPYTISRSCVITS